MVCHSGRIKGQPGVAMDDLIYICTKLARQMDAQVCLAKPQPDDLATPFTAASAAYVAAQERIPTCHIWRT